MNHEPVGRSFSGQCEPVVFQFSLSTRLKQLSVPQGGMVLKTQYPCRAESLVQYRVLPTPGPVGVADIEYR